MARSFHQSLLAAVVAVVVGGSALAQETPLQEAVTLLRLNKSAEAVEKLREILSSDPSNEDALSLYQSVSQDEWYMLMGEKGEIQQIARSILDRAQSIKREMSRDEATIQELVDTATAADNDYGTRQAATNKLVTDHGEFAVPPLVAKLGDSGNVDGQIHAISVLSQLGAVAVLPLIEATRSTNDLTVQNATAALHMIGDDRAAPVMAHLANDDRVNISTIAKKFLTKNGVRGDALSLRLAQSARYLAGNVPVGGYSDVVWSLVDDKLVATDVPALLYPVELAKSVARDAVLATPNSLDARSALAQANLAEANLIETSIAQGDETLAELAPIASELKIAAIASGVDALRSALDAGVRKGLAPVAIGAIQALAQAEIIDSVGDSSLVAALNSTDKRIKYAAADAIVSASRGAAVPQIGRVVEVLAEAVTEERVNTIKVIAPALESAPVVASTKSVRNIAVDASVNAVDAMRDLLANPNTDVVVINEILPDRLPEDVIGNIRKDGRMAHTRIVIVTKDEDAARERFGDDVGFITAPLNSENLQAAVATALEGVSNPGGTSREAYATKASQALLDLAQRKAGIGDALSNLALQLNRDDSVAVPAAKAIGLSGSEAEMPALLGALDSGSDELKKASAGAIGNLLARMASCPDNVAMALMGAMEASTDTELRLAVAIALGKAKIDGEKKVELMKKLGRVAGSSSEG